MMYTNENRGIIQNRERARQIIDFSGLRYGNITPTDIDGFFEIGNEVFVYFEFKLDGCEMPYGQKLALERQCDNIRAAGKTVVLFLCTHTCDNPQDDINAADATVESVYWNSKWHHPKPGAKLKEQVDKLVSYFTSMI